MNLLHVIRMKLEKRTIYKFIMFYVLIFLLIIGLFFILLQIIATRLVQHEKQSIEQVLRNNVQKIQLTMDEYLERCKIINYFLLQKENMHYMLQFDDNIPVGYSVNIYCIQNELKNLIISNNFISDIVVCMNEKNINIDSEGKMTDYDVYKKYIEQEANNLSYGEWINRAESFTGGQLICPENGVLYFLQTYPVTPRGDISKSATLIKIKENVLNNTLKGVDDTDGVITAIFDNKAGYNVTNSTKQEDFIREDICFVKDEGYMSQDGYLFAYKKSKQLPVTYISAIPQATLIGQRQKVQNFITIVFILFTILCCIFIVFFTLRAYNPIRQLLTFTRNGNSEISNFLDPYSEIKSMLLDAADKQLAYTNLHKQMDILEKQKKLITVLYDKKSTEELIQQSTEDAGIFCGNNQNCFIKLKCVDASTYFEKESDRENIDCTPIHFCEIILSQILSKDYDIISIPYGQEIFVIILLKNCNLEFFHKDIKKSLKQIQRLLQESYGIDTLITISNLHSGVVGLKYGLLEANKTMEYIEFTGNKGVAEYNLLPNFKYQNDIDVEYIHDETLMLDYIKSGEFDKAKATFNDIIDSYFNGELYNPHVYRFRLYALMGKILESLSNIDVPEVRKLINDEVNKNGGLLHFHNVIEFQERFNLLFDRLEKLCKNTKGEIEFQFVKDVMDIVLHNYMNPDLNVSMVANMLNMNLDYVSRTFKKLTGNGLLEYIQEIRINKAKSYLQENPELLIKEVSSMVGYINCESFIRVFKRKEGVTPGRYKSILEKQK